LKSLNLPPGITSITILADGDPTGEAAALAAARRLKNAVRIVRIVRAPPGNDFNDVLCTTAKRKSDA
jgi:DNA primase